MSKIKLITIFVMCLIPQIAGAEFLGVKKCTEPIVFPVNGPLDTLGRQTLAFSTADHPDSITVFTYLDDGTFIAWDSGGAAYACPGIDTTMRRGEVQIWFNRKIHWIDGIPSDSNSYTLSVAVLVWEDGYYRETNATVQVVTDSLNQLYAVRDSVNLYDDATRSWGANVLKVGGDAITDNGDGRLEVNVEEWKDVAPLALTSDGGVVVDLDSATTGGGAGSVNALEMASVNWVSTGGDSVLQALDYTNNTHGVLREGLAGVDADTGIAGIKTKLTTIAGYTDDIGIAGAGLTAADDAMITAIADVPTVAELEARTLPSANYFDPTTDPVAVVTRVDSVGHGGTHAIGLHLIDTNLVATESDLGLPANFSSLKINANGGVYLDTSAAANDNVFGGRELRNSIISTATPLLTTASGVIMASGTYSAITIGAVVDVIDGVTVDAVVAGTIDSSDFSLTGRNFIRNAPWQADTTGSPAPSWEGNETKFGFWNASRQAATGTNCGSGTQIDSILVLDTSGTDTPVPFISVSAADAAGNVWSDKSNGDGWVLLNLAPLTEYTFSAFSGAYIFSQTVRTMSDDGFDTDTVFGYDWIIPAPSTNGYKRIWGREYINDDSTSGPASGVMVSAVLSYRTDPGNGIPTDTLNSNNLGRQVRVLTRTDANGFWQLDVPINTIITPANSFWQVTAHGRWSQGYRFTTTTTERLSSLTGFR